MMKRKGFKQRGEQREKWFRISVASNNRPALLKDHPFTSQSLQYLQVLHIHQHAQCVGNTKK